MQNRHRENKMTVDEFTNIIQALAEVVKTKPPEEATKVIIETFETSNLDVAQIQAMLNLPQEEIGALQADVMLVLKFAMKIKESMKHQLQDIKKYQKAKELYNHHSAP
jgi:hypothetical protein